MIRGIVDHSQMTLAIDSGEGLHATITPSCHVLTLWLELPIRAQLSLPDTYSVNKSVSLLEVQLWIS